MINGYLWLNFRILRGFIPSLLWGLLNQSHLPSTSNKIDYVIDTELVHKVMAMQLNGP